MLSLENRPELLTTEDVTELLGKSEQSVRRMFRTGELPAVLIGRRWYMPKHRLIELVEGRGGRHPHDRNAEAARAEQANDTSELTTAATAARGRR